MKYHDFCNICIVSPCCSETCYETLVFLSRGKRAATKYARDGCWDSVEELERICGFSDDSQYAQLSDYYLQVSAGYVEIKIEDLKKLKRKKIEVAQVVHGRLYIDKMEAFILPHNRIAVDITELG